MKADTGLSGLSGIVTVLPTNPLIEQTNDFLIEKLGDFIIWG